MMDGALTALSPESPGLAAILALNNAHAAELSLLTEHELARMIAGAFRAASFGKADAFLLAFDQEANYASPNFLWFRNRLGSFVYVDRVVVAKHARGRGLAKRLYADLFAAAREAGYGIVCCEVNTDPPNAGSDAFHAALGFREVGRQAIHGGAKTVRYLERPVAGD